MRSNLVHKDCALTKIFIRLVCIQLDEINVHDHTACLKFVLVRQTDPVSSQNEQDSKQLDDVEV